MMKTDHPQAIDQAYQVLQSGGIVAFPTDTVYGIGCSAFNSQAIERLYQVKKRGKEKAIPILIADRSDLNKLVSFVSPLANALMDHFWPGPITLVLPIKAKLPSEISPGDTVGVRIPDSDFTRQLLRTTGPLATTSANISGRESARTAGVVREQLGKKIELILDGGETPGGRPSTVVDCTSDQPRILRPGPIPEARLCEVWEIHGEDQP